MVLMWEAPVHVEVDGKEIPEMTVEADGNASTEQPALTIVAAL
jgi:hypothetical protein